MHNELDSVHLNLFFTRYVSLGTWDAGGMLEREAALYKALSEKIAGVRFVTYGGRGEKKYRERLIGIDITYNPFLFMRPYRWWLMNAAPKKWGRPGIVKTNQVLGARLARDVARRHGMKFIVRCGYMFSANQAARFGKDSEKYREAVALEKEIFPETDRIVVTSQLARDLIVENYGIDKKLVSVVPNYVMTDVFKPQEVKRDPKKRICYVGRFHEEKNPAALLKAAKGLDAQLVMVGTGPQEAELRRLADELKLSVSFEGNVPNSMLPEIINSCDVFVLPSITEGHSKVLIEAMSCGIAVLASDIEANRLVVTHDENGCLSSNEPDALHGALEKLLSDESIRKRLGAAARETAVEYYSLDSIVKKELEVYRKTLNI